MGTLTVHFRQFFYLLNVKGKGGVVLLPSRDHTATMQVGNGQPFPLYRTQVSVVRWPAGQPEKRQRLWGQPTKPPGRQFLVHSEDIFGRPTRLAPGLVDDEVVPERLNARVVLSGGEFVEEEATNPDGRGDRWTFHINRTTPPRSLGPRALTDQLFFDLTFEDGYEYAIELQAGGAKVGSDILLPSDKTTVVQFVNRDAAAEMPPLHPGLYCLTEYDDLHALLDLRRVEATHPVGSYAQNTTAGFRSDNTPVCGGEQGECPDPEDPECEPPGSGGG